MAFSLGDNSVLKFLIQIKSVKKGCEIMHTYISQPFFVFQIVQSKTAEALLLSRTARGQCF
jgi:hypothetical protein